MTHPTYPWGIRNFVGWRAIGGAPIEIAAPTDKLSHHNPVTRDVPTPIQRVVPAPAALRTRAASVDQNNRSERILMVEIPRCCEIPTEIHDRWRANSAATATAEHPIPARVK
jgi:hypothetical protein